MKLMEYRKRAGISRIELSLATGIPYRTLCRWEKEHCKTIYRTRLNKLCAALGIGPNDLADFLDVVSA